MSSEAPVVASKTDNALAWTHYAGIAIAGLLLGAMLWPLRPTAGEGAMEVGPTHACALWDSLARESIARLVQDGKRDADLRKVGDAIFRLRRARRNCLAGWAALACQDYRAIAREIPGAVISQSSSQSACAANVEAAGAVR